MSDQLVTVRCQQQVRGLSEETLHIESPARRVRDQWAADLARAVRSRSTLLERLGLPEEPRTAESDFPILVPESFIARMRRGDRDDPLLLQVLATAAEEEEVPGFSADAVGDLNHRAAAGLIQKYPGRVLLIAAGSCAVHCRYCFRRHYPYGEEPRTLEHWKPAISAIANDSSIHEVILSGGDPLMLRDGRLRELLEMTDEIPHVRRIRIHTRLPIVLPSRVSDSLLQTLRGLTAQPWVVVHANHAAELTGDCADALRKLLRAGVPTLNQAVLLRRINDTISAQVELCERLIDLGVRPYYLNLLDPVAGAAHFAVSDAIAKKVVSGVRACLPGYAVPQIVRDTGAGPSKQPVDA